MLDRKVVVASLTLASFAVLTGCLDEIAPPVAASGGCPGATYPSWQTSPYVLPYPVGVAHRTDLTNCSGSYHSAGLPDAFAIDFNMSVGTVITAARGGGVVHVEESGRDGGFPNNLVVIDHGDGTYAQYMHLTQAGALVALGDTVSQGDTVGLSGVTGLAGYPHLHLVVTGDGWMFPYESIAVTFANTSPNERGLQPGVSYTALDY